jgi:hypothetical protein
MPESLTTIANPEDLMRVIPALSNLDEAHAFCVEGAASVDQDNRRTMQQAIASVTEVRHYLARMSAELAAGSYRNANASRLNALVAARELVALLDEE